MGKSAMLLEFSLIAFGVKDNGVKTSHYKQSLNIVIGGFEEMWVLRWRR